MKRNLMTVGSKYFGVTHSLRIRLSLKPWDLNPILFNTKNKDFLHKSFYFTLNPTRWVGDDIKPK